MQHTHPTGGDTSFVLYLRGHMYLNFYRGKWDQLPHLLHVVNGQAGKSTIFGTRERHIQMAAMPMITMDT